MQGSGLTIAPYQTLTCGQLGHVVGRDHDIATSLHILEGHAFPYIEESYHSDAIFASGWASIDFAQPDFTGAPAWCN